MSVKFSNLLLAWIGVFHLEGKCSHREEL
jgi:hypothetical protein